MRSKFASLVLCMMVLASANAEEVAVHAVALFNGKAMIAVNGSKPKIIQEGQTFKGVRLLKASTKEATIEVNGRAETLALNGAVTLSGGTAPKSSDGLVQLWQDEAGFFKAPGAINGEQVEFLVDTGANLVVISSAQANAIGLAYQNGQRAFASTASGRSPMYLIQADEISFASISLSNIQLGVIEGRFPEIPLLGMTFLERLDMNRSGNRMTLKKRF